jgi:phage FluMu protein Com
MMEVKVTLDFSCCICEHSVGVTLQCTGIGLTPSSRTVATVNIPCPTCNSVNQLYFEPNGTIRDVVPYRGLRRSLEPSAN